MIDLKTEFRTLNLLASALIIIGVGLSLSGFGLVLAMRDPAMKPRRSSDPGRRYDDDVPESSTTKVGYREKLSKSTAQLGMPTALLGLLILSLGGTLRWLIRNNLDDGDEMSRNNDLFKAYAEQLMVAERQKKKNRQRLEL